MNIDIGTRRQLFFDNHIIEMVQTMTRRMHLPVKHERNPLIRKDRPWEPDPYIRTGTMCAAHLEVDGRKTNICLGGSHHGQVYVAC